MLQIKCAAKQTRQGSDYEFHFVVAGGSVANGFSIKSQLVLTVLTGGKGYLFIYCY